jgi:hypothetical protein
MACGHPAAVDPPKLLRIALRHLRHALIDTVALAARFDCGLTAAVAASHRYLVAGSAFILWPAERTTRDLHEHIVVLHPAAHLSPDHALQIPKHGERLGLDLEGQAVRDQPRIARVARSVSDMAPSDGSFDLSRGLAGGPLRPGLLCFCRRDARQLSRCGPTQLAALKFGVQCRQCRKRSTHANALFCAPRLKVEHPLAILAQAGIAKTCKERHALSDHEQAANLVLQFRPLPTYRHEATMNSRPLRFMLVRFVLVRFVLVRFVLVRFVLVRFVLVERR